MSSTLRRSQSKTRAPIDAQPGTPTNQKKNEARTFHTPPREPDIVPRQSTRKHNIRSKSRLNLSTAHLPGDHFTDDPTETLHFPSTKRHNTNDIHSDFVFEDIDVNIKKNNDNFETTKDNHFETINNENKSSTNDLYLGVPNQKWFFQHRPQFFTSGCLNQCKLFTKLTITTACLFFAILLLLSIFYLWSLNNIWNVLLLLNLALIILYFPAHLFLPITSEDNTVYQEYVIYDRNHHHHHHQHNYPQHHYPQPHQHHHQPQRSKTSHRSASGESDGSAKSHRSEGRSHSRRRSRSRSSSRSRSNKSSSDSASISGGSSSSSSRKRDKHSSRRSHHRSGSISSSSHEQPSLLTEIRKELNAPLQSPFKLIASSFKSSNQNNSGSDIAGNPYPQQYRGRQPYNKYDHSNDNQTQHGYFDPNDDETDVIGTHARLGAGAPSHSRHPMISTSIIEDSDGVSQTFHQPVQPPSQFNIVFDSGVIVHTDFTQTEDEGCGSAASATNTTARPNITLTRQQRSKLAAQHALNEHSDDSNGGFISQEKSFLEEQLEGQHPRMLSPNDDNINNIHSNTIDNELFDDETFFNQNDNDVILDEEDCDDIVDINEQSIVHNNNNIHTNDQGMILNQHQRPLVSNVNLNFPYRLSNESLQKQTNIVQNKTTTLITTGLDKVLHILAYIQTPFAYLFFIFEKFYQFTFRSFITLYYVIKCLGYILFGMCTFLLLTNITSMLYKLPTSSYFQNFITSISPQTTTTTSSISLFDYTTWPIISQYIGIGPVYMFLHQHYSQNMILQSTLPPTTLFPTAWPQHSLTLLGIFLLIISFVTLLYIFFIRRRSPSFPLQISIFSPCIGYIIIFTLTSLIVMHVTRLIMLPPHRLHNHSDHFGTFVPLSQEVLTSFVTSAVYISSIIMIYFPNIVICSMWACYILIIGNIIGQSVYFIFTNCMQWYRDIITTTSDDSNTNNNNTNNTDNTNIDSKLERFWSKIGTLQDQFWTSQKYYRFQQHIIAYCRFFGIILSIILGLSVLTFLSLSAYKSVSITKINHDIVLSQTYGDDITTKFQNTPQINTLSSHSALPSQFTPQFNFNVLIDPSLAYTIENNDNIDDSNINDNNTENNHIYGTFLMNTDDMIVYIFGTCSVLFLLLTRDLFTFIFSPPVSDDTSTTSTPLLTNNIIINNKYSYLLLPFIFIYNAITNISSLTSQSLIFLSFIPTIMTILPLVTIVSQCSLSPLQYTILQQFAIPESSLISSTTHITIPLSQYSLNISMILTFIIIGLQCYALFTRLLPSYNYIYSQTPKYKRTSALLAIIYCIQQILLSWYIASIFIQITYISIVSYFMIQAISQYIKLSSQISSNTTSEHTTTLTTAPTTRHSILTFLSNIFIYDSCFGTTPVVYYNKHTNNQLSENNNDNANNNQYKSKYHDVSYMSPFSRFMYSNLYPICPALYDRKRYLLENQSITSSSSSSSPQISIVETTTISTTITPESTKTISTTKTTVDTEKPSVTNDVVIAQDEFLSNTIYREFAQNALLNDSLQEIMHDIDNIDKADGPVHISL